MARRFAEITFTDSVKAAQSRYGSREANRGFELSADRGDTLGEYERAFIEARDGFYQATVGQHGWPYVQFRGGPPGFLKVLDERTIGYADFRGNVQYISVGNLQADDRIALILMDYPNRRRLKIWARAKVIDEADAPDLIARLEIPSYRARVERAILLTVEAYDWNCPQHITPRYTEAEIQTQLLAPLEHTLASQEQELQALRSRAVSGERSREPADRILGDGPVALQVSGIRELTPTVRAYELRAAGDEPLPAWTPGAHLAIPVTLGEGRTGYRSYSLAGDPARTDHYLIAVRRDDQGLGGSVAVHRDLALGMRLRCALPQNHFELHEDARPALLIVGGIGITPLRAMALSLQRAGREFALHAIAPGPDELPFRSELAAELGAAANFWYTRAAGQVAPDLDRLLSGADRDTVIYVCGPTRLLGGILAAADRRNIDPARIRFERFAATPPRTEDRPLTVECRRSGKTLPVGADQSILDTVLAAGLDAPYGCRAGTCGTCAVKVLAGEPDHRDHALSDTERDRAGLFCPCVSRAHGEHLVLDL